MVLNHGALLRETEQMGFVLTDAFWATMAQVMAVFALTLTVEVRFALGQWDDETPRWMKMTQAISFVVIGVLTAVSFFNCVWAMLLKSWSNEGNALFVTLAASGAIGLLALGPVWPSILFAWEKKAES